MHLCFIFVETSAVYDHVCFQFGVPAFIPTEKYGPAQASQPSALPHVQPPNRLYARYTATSIPFQYINPSFFLQNPTPLSAHPFSKQIYFCRSAARWYCGPGHAAASADATLSLSGMERPKRAACSCRLLLSLLSGRGIRFSVNTRSGFLMGRRFSFRVVETTKFIFNFCEKGIDKREHIVYDTTMVTKVNPRRT